MRVLVTGGTGVVGTSAVSALLERGHQVRLLSRHAGDDARQWPAGVEPWPGNVADAASVEGSARGCDAVLHLVGIVDESPPNATFERVNVEGTRNILNEAARSNVPRFVFVSSLGADRGESPYHESKREAEAIVRGFARSWLIVRPGNVYGPGDEQISLLLTMVRTLPAVPIIGDGDQQFQPVWHEDIARALAAAVERTDLEATALDVAGAELTSERDLVERFKRITSRDPIVVPLPEFLASSGIKVLETIGLDIPFNESQLAMLAEGNRIPASGYNALPKLLGAPPTPLERGLELLADAQPESLPGEGVGALRRKRFWADIRGSRFDPDELLDYVGANFARLSPATFEVGAEPGTPKAAIALGETLTLALPLRGHVQVRVGELRDRSMTLLTLEGHPLTGAVRFLTRYEGDAVRFEVQTFDRPANIMDFIMMRTLGELLQNRTWTQLVENVVKASGGEAPRGVEHESESLDDEESRGVESWARELATGLKRDAAPEVKGERSAFSVERAEAQRPDAER